MPREPEASATPASASGSFPTTTRSAARALGNVISSNNRGVALESTASGNVVAGNFIGTNFDGTAALGNAQEGVIVAGTNNLIGGMVPGSRHVISGNSGRGIAISGNTAVG